MGASRAPNGGIARSVPIAVLVPPMPEDEHGVSEGKLVQGRKHRSMLSSAVPVCATSSWAAGRPEPGVAAGDPEARASHPSWPDFSKMAMLNRGPFAWEGLECETAEWVRNHIVTALHHAGADLPRRTLAVLEAPAAGWRAPSSRGLRIDTVSSVLPAMLQPSSACLFVLVCGAAGFLVRLSFLKRWGDRVDARLSRMVPGYSQLRAETKKKVGAEKEQEPPRFERHAWSGSRSCGNPHISSKRTRTAQTRSSYPRRRRVPHGQVYVVHPSQLQKLGIDSVELNAHLKDFGKGILTAHARPGA